jgi:hypothetical protein
MRIDRLSFLDQQLIQNAFHHLSGKIIKLIIHELGFDSFGSIWLSWSKIMALPANPKPLYPNNLNSPNPGPRMPPADALSKAKP